MGLTLEAVLARLEGVRQTGDRYRARCPAHGSRGLTLSVGVGGEGRILIYCFAGCELSEVASAIGVDVRDLMPALAPGEKLPPRPPERGYACGCVTDCQGKVKVLCAEGKRLRDELLMAMWYAEPIEKVGFRHWFRTKQARAWDAHFQGRQVSGPVGRWPK